MGNIERRFGELASSWSLIPDTTERQLHTVIEHERQVMDAQLGLLVTAYWICTAIGLLAACAAVFFLVLKSAPLDPAAHAVPWHMMIAAIAIGTALVTLPLGAALCIARRKGYRFILTAAAVLCLFLPIGTALGVATFILLLRPSMQTLFDAAASKSMPGRM